MEVALALAVLLALATFGGIGCGTHPALGAMIDDMTRDDPPDAP